MMIAQSVQSSPLLSSGVPDSRRWSPAQKHKRGIWLCAKLGEFHQDCVTSHICVGFLCVFESVFLAVCILYLYENVNLFFAQMGKFHKYCVTIHICVCNCIWKCISISICICFRHISGTVKHARESGFVPNWVGFTRQLCYHSYLCIYFHLYFLYFFKIFLSAFYIYIYFF